MIASPRSAPPCSGLQALAQGARIARDYHLAALQSKACVAGIVAPGLTMAEPGLPSSVQRASNGRKGAVILEQARAEGAAHGEHALGWVHPLGGGPPPPLRPRGHRTELQGLGLERSGPQH